MLDKITVGNRTLVIGKGPEDSNSGYIGKNFFSLGERPNNKDLGEPNSIFDSSACEEAEDEDAEEDYGDDSGDNDDEIGKYDDGFFPSKDEGSDDTVLIEEGERYSDLLKDFDDFP